MEEIDLILLVKEFWKKKKLIIIIFCIALLITSLFFIIAGKEKSIYTESKYFSKASIFISTLKQEGSIEIEKASEFAIMLVKSDLVLDEVKNSTGIEKINKENIIINDLGNQIINIGVIGATSEETIEISNSLLDITKKVFNEEKNSEGFEFKIINYANNSCEEYTEEVLNEFMDSTDLSSNKNITDSSKDNSFVKKAIIVIFLSGIISFGTVFVIFILDTKIKSVDQVERIGLNVIDSLENMKNDEYSIEKELTTIFDFKSRNSKIFKIIATKILNKINLIDKNVIMITSANEKEGKTYVASNLGTVLAMFGKKTIILDTNFENPKLDKIFKTPNDLGLSNYLTGMNREGENIKETLNNFIQETDIKNLNIISAGDIKENITNCLVSEKVDELIKQLKFYYDFIILDSDCILDNPNTLILAQRSNQIILVINEDATKEENLIKAKKDIESINGKIFGAVFNNINKK